MTRRCCVPPAYAPGYRLRHGCLMRRMTPARYVVYVCKLAGHAVPAQLCGRSKGRKQRVPVLVDGRDMNMAIIVDRDAKIMSYLARRLGVFGADRINVNGIQLASLLERGIRPKRIDTVDVSTEDVAATEYMTAEVSVDNGLTTPDFCDELAAVQPLSSTVGACREPKPKIKTKTKTEADPKTRARAKTRAETMAKAKTEAKTEAKTAARSATRGAVLPPVPPLVPISSYRGKTKTKTKTGNGTPGTYPIEPPPKEEEEEEEGESDVPELVPLPAMETQTILGGPPPLTGADSDDDEDSALPLPPPLAAATDDGDDVGTEVETEAETGTVGCRCPCWGRCQHFCKFVHRYKQDCDRDFPSGKCVIFAVPDASLGPGLGKKILRQPMGKFRRFCSRHAAYVPITNRTCASLIAGTAPAGTEATLSAFDGAPVKLVLGDDGRVRVKVSQGAVSAEVTAFVADPDDPNIMVAHTTRPLVQLRTGS